MKPIIVDEKNFEADYEQAALELRIKPGNSHSKELKHLAREASEIGRPKAMYIIAPIKRIDENAVSINGQPFQSRVLCSNLDGIHRAFPYIATCGIELHNWKQAMPDPFTGFLADTITSLALRKAIETLYSQLTNNYGLKKTATMNPGSLEDWPLQAQTPLFSLLGDPKKAIGVELTPSLLMLPRQSVSGILFETETDFVNCQLCPRDECSNRRAAYDSTKKSQYLD
jgi:hypothetical protein